VLFKIGVFGDDGGGGGGGVRPTDPIALCLHTYHTLNDISSAYAYAGRTLFCIRAREIAGIILYIIHIILLRGAARTLSIDTVLNITDTERNLFVRAYMHIMHYNIIVICRSIGSHDRGATKILQASIYNIP